MFTGPYKDPEGPCPTAFSLCTTRGTGTIIIITSTFIIIIIIITIIIISKLIILKTDRRMQAAGLQRQNK